jgi:hypothetical protein
MVHDSEHGAARAVAAQLARAPFACAAGEVDFADDALAALQLADEFVAGSSVKTVVSAAQFEIGGADSGGGDADARESFFDARERPAAEFHAAGFKVNGEHRLK